MNKLIIALIAMMLVSCDDAPKVAENKNESANKNQNVSVQPIQNEENFQDEHNSENSLDWAGVYEGIFPCADCEGIKTTLTLSYEGDFELKEVYEKGDDTFIAPTLSGKFQWDKNGSIIYIPTEDGKRTFFVGEGQVTAYDTEGNQIKSNLNYTLKQIEVFNINLDEDTQSTNLDENEKIKEDVE